MLVEFQSHLKKARISPRKARLVADAVRGKQVNPALDILRHLNKKAAGMVSGIIKTAVANAHQLATVDSGRLFISEIFVGDGPTDKRFLPRAQGRATVIRKRTSHISVKLCEK